MSLSSKFGDARMKRLGTRLRKIYAQASEELTEKVNSFFASFEKADKEKAALVEAGKLAKKEYIQWRKNKMLMGDKYMDLRDTMDDRSQSGCRKIHQFRTTCCIRTQFQSGCG